MKSISHILVKINEPALKQRKVLEKNEFHKDFSLQKTVWSAFFKIKARISTTNSKCRAITYLKGSQKWAIQNYVC